MTPIAEQATAILTARVLYDADIDASDETVHAHLQDEEARVRRMAAEKATCWQDAALKLAVIAATTSNYIDTAGDVLLASIHGDIDRLQHADERARRAPTHAQVRFIRRVEERARLHAKDRHMLA